MEDDIAGVRFVEAGPISYCKPGELRLGVGDYGVVRGERGERLGWVVVAPDQVLASEHQGPKRLIDRIATEADVEAWRANRERASEDTGRAQALATRSDPRVRVASLEYDLAGEYAELTFNASDRVEHEWLGRQVTDLLGCDTRVTQVGDRDRAKSLGGLGVCGLALCCSTWMTEFPTISIRMAKEQDLSPNPSKISGVCGRLLCCLSFEVEDYRELRGQLPKVGKWVTTPIGRAKVLSISTLEQVVRLRFEATGEVAEISAEELRAQYGAAVRPEELEDSIEEPLRARSRDLQDNLLAVVTQVDAPAPAGAGESDGEATAEATAEDGAERPKRRRRRGRRGGRRRRGGQGGQASQN